MIPIVEAAEDWHGLCRAWQLRASSNWLLGQAADAAEAWEHAAGHAGKAGEQHKRADILWRVASSMFWGPRPVEAGIHRCEEIHREVRVHPASEAEVLRILGSLYAFAGELGTRAGAVRRERRRVRGPRTRARSHDLPRPPHRRHGRRRPCRRGRELRAGYEFAEASGENGLRSTTATFLARAILAQGRHEEARWFNDVGKELCEPDDLLTNVSWSGVEARLLAFEGQLEDAEARARESVTLADRTDWSELPRRGADGSRRRPEGRRPRRRGVGDGCRRPSAVRGEGERARRRKASARSWTRSLRCERVAPWCGFAQTNDEGGDQGMGVQEFSDVIEFDNQEPFVRVTGLMESEYASSWVYVGLIQLTGKTGDPDREISGAAYGLGPVSMRDAWDGGARVKRGDALMSEWNMVLQRDVDNPSFVEGPAFGFVLVQKPGGGFTGWIDMSTTLKQRAAAAAPDAATSRTKAVTS